MQNLRLRLSAVYGERGRGFVEYQHVMPLAELSPGTKTKLADLAIVCANCHRIIHRQAPWLSLDELRRVLAAQTPSSV